MYIESVPNRNSPPCILLRESRREGKKIVKKTLLNLTAWPPELVENFRRLLKGGSVVDDLSEAFRITRSLPHGHVAAVWGTMRKLGLITLLSRRSSRQRSLAAAMIAARIADPRSKLATARGLDAATRTSTLPRLAGLGQASAEDLYGALDWLLERQQAVERKLAGRHLSEGSLVLYDLTSAYFEGRSCPLAQMGYSRDGKKGKLQIVVGLICNEQLLSVQPDDTIALRVFESRTAAICETTVRTAMYDSSSALFATLPRMPLSEIVEKPLPDARSIRSASNAFFNVRTIASCPIRSANRAGRYLRART